MTTTVHNEERLAGCLAVSLFGRDLTFAIDFRIQPYRVIGTVTRVLRKEGYKARST